MAAPLGDSSENSLLLRKLLYESYQGRSTVPVASSTGFPGISVNFKKTLRSLKDRYPCVTAVTLRLEEHTRDVTYGLVFHPIMRCESTRKSCAQSKEMSYGKIVFGAQFYTVYRVF